MSVEANVVCCVTVHHIINILFSILYVHTVCVFVCFVAAHPLFPNPEHCGANNRHTATTDIYKHICVCTFWHGRLTKSTYIVRTFVFN